MSIAANKTTVRRYFDEALDKRNLDVLDEIVTINCIIHRPEAAEPKHSSTRWKGFFRRIASSLQRSTI